MKTYSETAPSLLATKVSLAYPAPSLVAGGEAEVGGLVTQHGRHTKIDVLRNISFELSAGDSLALIGHNGSGKTTLLRVLAGIIQPNTGSVVHTGSLGTALNVNIGFRMEATGRHNIRLKALIAGINRKDIDGIIANVEAFASLGPYLNMPMHTYSKGMSARLAFGIATAFEYNILLLDEWLGAGDLRMRELAAQRMDNFVSSVEIKVIASHNQSLLERLCNKALLLEKGESVFQGSVDEALEIYKEQQTPMVKT